MPGSAPGGGRDSAELEISKINLSVHKGPHCGHVEGSTIYKNVSCMKVCIETLMKSTLILM